MDNSFYNEEQLRQIELGQFHGLSEEQISLYSNPNFSFGQMYEIRTGFENGLSMNQVSLYASTDYNENEMGHLREGYEAGLNDYQMGFYAKQVPFMDEKQLFEIRKGFQHELSIEQVAEYSNAGYQSGQMQEIRLGLENGFSVEQLNSYKDPAFSRDQMVFIRESYEQGYSLEQVSTWANPDFNYNQMNLLQSSANELSLEQLQACANPQFDFLKMNTVIDGYKSHLTDFQMNLISSPDYNGFESKVLLGVINQDPNYLDNYMDRLPTSIWKDERALAVISISDSSVLDRILDSDVYENTIRILDIVYYHYLPDDLSNKVTDTMQEIEERQFYNSREVVIGHTKILNPGERVAEFEDYYGNYNTEHHSIKYGGGTSGLVGLLRENPNYLDFVSEKEAVKVEMLDSILEINHFGKENINYFTEYLIDNSGRTLHGMDIISVYCNLIEAGTPVQEVFSKDYNTLLNMEREVCNSSWELTISEEQRIENVTNAYNELFNGYTMDNPEIEEDMGLEM